MLDTLVQNADQITDISPPPFYSYSHQFIDGPQDRMSKDDLFNPYGALVRDGTVTACFSLFLTIFMNFSYAERWLYFYSVFKS